MEVKIFSCMHCIRSREPLYGSFKLLEELAAAAQAWGLMEQFLLRVMGCCSPCLPLRLDLFGPERMVWQHRVRQDNFVLLAIPFPKRVRWARTIRCKKVLTSQRACLVRREHLVLALVQRRALRAKLERLTNSGAL